MSATEQATTLISNVGFPITAFLLMYRMTRQTIKENTQTLRDLQNEIQNL